MCFPGIGDVSKLVVNSNASYANSPNGVSNTGGNGVLCKLKHIFPNTYQRIKSICSPAKGGTGCYRFNYQPGT